MTNTIPDSQLLDLKEKAGKATKGPYHYDQETPWDQGDCYARSCIVIDESKWWCENSRITGGEACQDVSTAAYLAACDPSTISTLVDEIVELRKDKERLDCAQALLFGCDFAWGRDEETEGESVVLLKIPNGVRVGKDFRAFCDAALQARGKE